MRESSLRRLVAPFVVLFGVLAGCATPDSSLVGTDSTAVLTRHGSPAETFRLADGGERWLYPLGGLQQYVWAVDFDAAGRVARVTQLRTAANFGRVRVGIDTEDDVRREFGAPRLMMPFSRVGLVAWMYPFVEDRVWNQEMAIYFDPQGIVRRVESGPDPRFLGGGDDRR